MLQVCTNNAIPTTKEIKERRILSSTLTQYCMLLHKGQVHSDFVCWVGGCSKVLQLNIQMIHC